MYRAKKSSMVLFFFNQCLLYSETFVKFLMKRVSRDEDGQTRGQRGELRMRIPGASLIKAEYATAGAVSRRR